MKKTLVLLASFCLFLSTILYAEVMWENDLSIRTSTAIAWNACSAPTSDGSVIYAWSDLHQGNRNIYIQKVNNQGSMVWSTPVAVVSAAHAQSSPVIVPTSDNNYIVFWITTVDSNSGGDIYAQKITSGGQRLWLEDGVPVCTAAGRQWDVKAVKDNFGGAFVTWSDQRIENEHIYAQHLDGFGNSLWLADGICLEPNSLDTVRSIIQDGSSGVIISYDSDYEIGRSVHIQRLGADGIPLWTSPLTIGDDTYNEMECDSRLLLLNNNEFYVFWQYYYNSITHLYLQKYNTSGQAVWDNPLIVGGDSLADLRLQKVRLANDGIFIAYYKHTGTEYNLFMQKLDENGQMLWNEANTNLGAVNLYIMAGISNIIPDPTGGCYLAWTRYPPQDFSASDVWAQHFSADGYKTWGADGALLCNSDRTQGTPTLDLAANRLFIGWSDNRLGSMAIYYQVLNTGGVPLLEANGRQLYYGLNSMYVDSRITLSRSNDIVVIWMDDRIGWETNLRYYMQGINPDGSVDYAENGIELARGLSNRSFIVAAAVTPQDNVVILWQEVLQYHHQLWAQMIDLNGNPLWGTGGILVATSEASYIGQAYLSIAGNDLYVSWSAVYSSETACNSRVWGQKITNGQMQWGPAGIMIREWPTTDTTHNFNLCALDRNCFIWTENTGAENSTVAKAKLVGADGSAAPGWSNEGNLLCSAPQVYTANPTDIRIKSFGENWVVTWNQYDQIIGYLLRGQLLSASGTLLWGADGLVIQDTTLPETRLLADADNDCVVVLITHLVDNRGNLLAKAYNTAGNLLWTSGLIGQTQNYATTQSIVQMENGSYTIMWEAFTNNVTAPGIKYNYLSPQGVVFNANGGYNVLQNQDFAYTPQAVPNGNDTYLCWTDGNSYRDEPEEHCNIFVQKLNSPYVANQDDHLPLANQLCSLSSYPNPFRTTTTLDLSLKQDIQSTISIYNTRGQQVRILHKGLLAKGTHQLQWDSRDNNGRPVASGVYFCRMETPGSTISKKLLLIK